VSENKQNRSWDKLPEESGKAFEAADVYFKLGTTRSVREVAEKCKKSESRFYKLSHRYNWTERAAAYDEFCRQIKIREHEESLKIAARESEETLRKRRIEIRDLEYELGKRFVELGEKHLERYAYLLKFPVIEQTTLKTETTDDGTVNQHITVKPLPHRTGDSVKAIAEGLRLMRSSTEMPTETIQHSFSDTFVPTQARDLQGLTKEQIDERKQFLAGRKAELQKRLENISE
jgi:hypothetical protein